MPTSNTTNDFLNFNLPQDAYVAFDAVSLKDYIIDRLNENEKFTDQNYEGSNLAAVIDIIAYSYHVLLFYLNNTASEVDFDQATLYENMNRIVKLIGYKPAGKQTSMVPINGVASADLATSNYTIKKYSYFLAGGVQYNFIDNISFDKVAAGQETLTTLNNNAVLYQGSIGEYPDYIAQGEKFEVLPIVVENLVNEADDRFIADNTLSVAVKETADDTYYQYKEVDSLYLTNSVDRVYEKRLNEDGNFEIKFGNGVFGKRLAEGDTVAVDYILSDNAEGIISKNIINGNKLFVYDSARRRAVFNDTFANKQDTTFLDITNSSYITFNNPVASSTLAHEETVDQIRQNAPKLFSSQLRLVSESDYETFFKKNMANILQSVKVVDNDSYINEYIKYFYDICVDANKVNSVIINQVNFADSCDFNNINVFVVPKFTLTEDKTYPPDLSVSFKNLIVDLSKGKKIVSNSVVPRDPVYMAYGLGISNKGTLEVSDLDNTKLYVVRETTNKINKGTLISRVSSLIKEFFLAKNNTLGENLKIIDLTNSILSLEGIKRVYTSNKSEGVTFEGISFISFNPLYPESDISVINQDVTLPYFKFPYLYSPMSVANRIEVIDE